MLEHDSSSLGSKNYHRRRRRISHKHDIDTQNTKTNWPATNTDDWVLDRRWFSVAGQASTLPVTNKCWMCVGLGESGYEWLLELNLMLLVVLMSESMTTNAIMWKKQKKLKNCFTGTASMWPKPRTNWRASSLLFIVLFFILKRKIKIQIIQIKK